VWWPSSQSTRDNHVMLVTLPNIHQCNFFTDRLRNKPFLIWLLTTIPHLKYVATLPCNLSLTACFLTLMFYRVVWQHMQGVVGFLIGSLLSVDASVWDAHVHRLSAVLRFVRLNIVSIRNHCHHSYVETDGRIELVLGRYFFRSTLHRGKFGYRPKSKGNSLRNFVPNSGLLKIRLGASIVALCYQLSKLVWHVWTISVINWRPSSVELSWQ